MADLILTIKLSCPDDRKDASLHHALVFLSKSVHVLLETGEIKLFENQEVIGVGTYNFRVRLDTQAPLTRH